MNSLSLYLPFQAVSVNQMHIPKNGRLISSQVNNKFRSAMREYLKSKEAFVREFCDRCSGVESLELKAHIIFWIPENKFYTKKGIISKTSSDVGNLEKSLTDAIFENLKIYNPNLDDALLTEIILEKKKTDRKSHGISFLLYAA